MSKSKLFIEAKKNNLKLSLKEWREIKGFTQKEAAEKAGVSKEAWSNYENMKTFPNVPVIMRIEQALDVEYNDIIFLPEDYGLTVNSRQPA